MENNGVRLTPEQARSALADTAQVRASTAALSATPWPTWFFVALTLYIALVPLAYAGLVADGGYWLLSRPAWAAVLVGTSAVYLGLFGVAAKRWRDRTGVALRFDVLPKKVVVPLLICLPVVLLGAGLMFRVTGWAGWPVLASLIGVATSVGFHLTFVRLHRRLA
jgi:hypothetical protein